MDAEQSSQIRPEHVARGEALGLMAEIHNVASVEWDKFSGWILTASAACITFMLTHGENLGVHSAKQVSSLIGFFVGSVFCGVLQKLIRVQVLMRHAGISAGLKANQDIFGPFLELVAHIAGIAGWLARRSVKSASSERSIRAFSIAVQLQALFCLLQVVLMLIGLSRFF